MSTAMPSIATVPSTTIKSIRTTTAWKLPSAARTSHMNGASRRGRGRGEGGREIIPERGPAGNRAPRTAARGGAGPGKEKAARGGAGGRPGKGGGGGGVVGGGGGGGRGVREGVVGVR